MLLVFYFMSKGSKYTVQNQIYLMVRMLKELKEIKYAQGLYTF